MAHFSVASLTQVVLLLVFICWTPSSSGAAFSLEEEFLQLKENYVRKLKFLFHATLMLSTIRFNWLLLILLCYSIWQQIQMKQAVKSLESTAIELQAKVGKVTQLEAQLELNASPILFSLIQSFTVGKHFRFSMTE
jgi:hypothetical protein